MNVLPEWSLYDTAEHYRRPFGLHPSRFFPQNRILNHTAEQYRRSLGLHPLSLFHQNRSNDTVEKRTSPRERQDEWTAFITIHQLRSYSHTDAHHDPSALVPAHLHPSAPPPPLLAHRNQRMLAQSAWARPKRRLYPPPRSSPPLLHDVPSRHRFPRCHAQPPPSLCERHVDRVSVPS